MADTSSLQSSKMSQSMASLCKRSSEACIEPSIHPDTILKVASELPELARERIYGFKILQSPSLSSLYEMMATNNQLANMALMSQDPSIKKLMPSVLTWAIRSGHQDLVKRMLKYPKLIQWSDSSTDYIISIQEFSRIFKNTFSSPSLDRAYLSRYVLQRLAHSIDQQLVMDHANFMIDVIFHNAILVADIDLVMNILENEILMRHVSTNDYSKYLFLAANEMDSRIFNALTAKVEFIESMSADAFRLQFIIEASQNHITDIKKVLDTPILVAKITNEDLEMVYDLAVSSAPAGSIARLLTLPPFLERLLPSTLAIGLFYAIERSEIRSNVYFNHFLDNRLFMERIHEHFPTALILAIRKNKQEFIKTVLKKPFLMQLITSASAYQVFLRAAELSTPAATILRENPSIRSKVVDFAIDRNPRVLLSILRADTRLLSDIKAQYSEH